MPNIGLQEGNSNKFRRRSFEQRLHGSLWPVFVQVGDPPKRTKVFALSNSWLRIHFLHGEKWCKRVLPMCKLKTWILFRMRVSVARRDELSRLPEHLWQRNLWFWRSPSYRPCNSESHEEMPKMQFLGIQNWWMLSYLLSMWNFILLWVRCRLCSRQMSMRLNSKISSKQTSFC